MFMHNLCMSFACLLPEMLKYCVGVQHHVCARKYVPTATSSGMDISEVPGCHLLQQMSSQIGVS